MGAPAPATAAPAPQAERKLVSVLFADLVGFTSLSETRDAEDVRELLTRYFDTARKVIARYGGTVEKFIGDAVMAVWGTPAAKEDDAERAVRAALELVDAIAALGEGGARISEGENEEAVRHKLTEMLAAHIADPDDRAWIEPRLAHLLALDEGSFEREDLFSAWRLFFERLSEGAPTVLVFEDLQWADTGLLDFIEYLLEWSRSHPLFVVTLSRPDLLDRRADWGAGWRNFTSMFLEPLTDPAMSDLLTGLVPGLPFDVLTRIRERAEGVPLYAVETVRMLLDRGSLRREENRYVLTGEVESLDVPETLHALIAARLDGLPERERRYLQDASVLGKTFTKERLAAIADRESGDLDDALAALVRKEMLAVEADSRSPERGQYGFSQSLVQQVAYGTLSKRERKTRHLAAAVEFEATSGDDDEISEVVASHYVEAYRADPDAEDAQRIRAKARTMLIKAGRRADRSRLAPKPSGTTNRLRSSPRTRRSWPSCTSAPAFRKAERGFRDIEEMLWVAVTLLQHGEWTMNAGRREEAVALLDEARALFRRMRAAPWLDRLEEVAAGAAERPPEAQLRHLDRGRLRRSLLSRCRISLAGTNPRRRVGHR